MNKFLHNLTPEWALRAGLGVMYLYSGIDIIRHPTSWFWAVRPILKFLPSGLQASLSAPDMMTKYLIVQGAAEIIFAIVLLAWFIPRYMVKWVALISVLEMAGILLLIPIDAITFRDFGLLGASLALWLILMRGDSYSIPAEKHESGGLNRAEHHDEPDRITKKGLLPQPGEPVVETFDEFMKHGK